MLAPDVAKKTGMAFEVSMWPWSGSAMAIRTDGGLSAQPFSPRLSTFAFALAVKRSPLNATQRKCHLLVGRDFYRALEQEAV